MAARRGQQALGLRRVRRKVQVGEQDVLGASSRSHSIFCGSFTLTIISATENTESASGMMKPPARM